MCLFKNSCLKHDYRIVTVTKSPTEHMPLVPSDRENVDRKLQLQKEECYHLFISQCDKDLPEDRKKHQQRLR